MDNYSTAFVMSQALVGVAIIFDIISFQLKDRIKIVFCLSVAGILISAHFLLMEQWTASTLMLVATSRYLFSIFTRSKNIRSIFYAASIGITYFSYAGIASIVSCIGSLLQTTAAFSKNDKMLRLTMMLGTCFWLAHNIIVSSPTAVLMEVLFLISNIVGYCRFYTSGKTGSETVSTT